MYHSSPYHPIQSAPSQIPPRLGQAALCLALLLSACGGSEGPPIVDELQGLSGSYSCSEVDGSITWTFEVVIAGPANNNSTRVWVDPPDGAATESHLLTVLGSTADRTTFGNSISGTPEGEVPATGALPYDCGSEGSVWIRFCGSPDGMPTEVPCWLCGEESDGDLPEQADAWLPCSGS